MKYTGLNSEEIHKKCKHEIKKRISQIENLEKRCDKLKVINSNLERASRLAETRVQILQLETELSVFIRVHDWINDWGL